MSSILILVISAIIYFQLSLFILNFFDQNVHQPYMDEVFHVPQAQQYCLGNYNEWNDKITTLPGLYLLSTSVIRIVQLVFKNEDPLSFCDAYWLRLSNVILSTFNFIVLFKIFNHLNSKRLENKKFPIFYNLLSAFSMSLFPLNYFFQFLYYTDSGSTLFILIAYYLQLKSKYEFSAIFGSIAIFYRQTNVIWLGFCTILIILSKIESLFVLETKSKLRENIDDSTLATITQQRSKKHSNLFEFIVKTPNEAFGKNFEILKFLQKLYREDFWGKKIIYSDLFKVFYLRTLQPHLIVMLTFVFFVFANNGIVVGDRSNHQASFHLTQMLYFWSFSCFFSISSFIFSFKKIKNLFNFLVSNVKILLVFVLPLLCIIVHNFSYEHPFLLADNRHYTFYIWSKLIRKHELVKYLLTPAYLIASYLFYRNLTLTGKSLGWLLCYSLCLFVGLVPQKLIEFRYFIIPFYIYRLNINLTTWKELILELLVNSLINAATIYIFLNKTFRWPDGQDVQRFMW